MTKSALRRMRVALMCSDVPGAKNAMVCVRVADLRSIMPEARTKPQRCPMCKGKGTVKT